MGLTSWGGGLKNTFFQQLYKFLKSGGGGGLKPWGGLQVLLALA